MSDVVNFALPVSVDGKHYKGFTVHAGVDLDLADGACVPGYKVITFSNAKKAPQNVPMAHVSLKSLLKPLLVISK